MNPDVEEIPDEELVPDSEGLRGREELLKSVKKIRQVLREEGLSKSQAHSVLAFAVRSLLLRWP